MRGGATARLLGTPIEMEPTIRVERTTSPHCGVLYQF